MEWFRKITGRGRPVPLLRRRSWNVPWTRHAEFIVMITQRYIYWQDDDAWLGYLEEFPDYWTQGESEAELKEHLIDLYKELISGAIPNVRRVAELDIT
jgi:predicted RNase H-like HicB family nuclease